jgi:tRNA pseudouridine38-40 synthase
MRIKISIEYDGNEFYGWQIQKDFRTCQGEIENALKKIFSKNIRIKGASRLDRGVHAISQVAHFDISKKILNRYFKSLEDFKRSLNSILPDSIYIKDIEIERNDFHARFSAKGKIYVYKIFIGRSPLKRKYFWEIDYKININSLYKMAKFLRGERDFKKWSPGHKGKGIVNIFDAGWKRKGNVLIFYIAGDRFLNKLVRSIVGQMIFLAKEGKYLKFKEYIEKGPEKIIIAPPQGLYLAKVFYEDYDKKMIKEIIS